MSDFYTALAALGKPPDIDKIPELIRSVTVPRHAIVLASYRSVIREHAMLLKLYTGKVALIAHKFMPDQVGELHDALGASTDPLEQDMFQKLGAAARKTNLVGSRH